MRRPLVVGCSLVVGVLLLAAGGAGAYVVLSKPVEVAAPPAPVPTKKPSKRKHHKVSGATVTASSAGTADLVLPPEQPCKAGPSDVAGDEGMAASVGLSEEEVRDAMSAFVGNTLRCVPPEGAPSGTITTEITVACTGRVSRVDVTDDGGMPPAMVDCVKDTLRYAPFPAHDMPDGYTFGYPLRFTF